MIDLDSYPIFSDNRSTLKETSLDDGNGQKAYMTDSTISVIDFDRVKEQYVKALGLSEIPKSNDALFEDGKGSVIFVEFKNGVMNPSKRYDVQKKVYDSALIFTDITSTKISDMRDSVRYFLVYNETANRDNRSDKELVEKNKRGVQPSSSFDSIAKTLRGYAKKEYICFGLRMFQNYCFKEVHTYTEAEFEAYLTTLPCQRP